MKTVKVATILLSLLSLSSLHAKRYSSSFQIECSKMIRNTPQDIPNVFDVAIFIEGTSRKTGRSHEEVKARNGNLALAVTKKIGYLINNKEAGIISTPLMRAFIAAASDEVGNKIATKGADFKKEYDQLKKRKPINFSLEEFQKAMILKNKNFESALKKLKSGWFIFITKDNEFVLLIPKSKYPEIKSPKDIQKIGLNPKVIAKAITWSELKTLPMQKSRGDVPISNLFDIFLKTPAAKKVNKRIFLNGHGSETIIANLSKRDFKKLKGVFQNIGCSFLFVSSCYAGKTVPETFSVPRQGLASGKNFIEVTKGLPRHSTYTPQLNFENFFLRINCFLKSEMLKSGYEIDEVTEQKMFTKRYKDNLKNRQDAKKSKLFGSIFSDFLVDVKKETEIPVNIITPRFPYDGIDKVENLNLGLTEEQQNRVKKIYEKEVLGMLTEKEKKRAQEGLKEAMKLIVGAKIEKPIAPEEPDEATKLIMEMRMEEPIGPEKMIKETGKEYLKQEEPIEAAEMIGKATVDPKYQGKPDKAIELLMESDLEEYLKQQALRQKVEDLKRKQREYFGYKKEKR